MTQRRRLLAMALTLVLTRVPAFGQAGDETPKGAPSIGARSDIVLVDVVVTDRRGQPVTGLSRDDFLVFEDGRPVEVVAFRAPRSGTSDTADTVTAPGSVEPAAAQPADPMTVVLYLENSALTPAGRRRVLDGFRSFVGERLPSGAFRALVISAAQGTQAATTVTTSVEEVGAALEAIAGTTAGGVLAQSEERQAIDMIRVVIETCEQTPLCGTCLDVLDQVLGIARAYAESRRALLSAIIERLATVVGALGALPGRKALVYPSEILEQRPGIHLFHQIGEICPEAMQKDFSKVLSPMEEHDASGALRELAARANAARITLYPLDARGLEGPSVGDVSFAERRYIPSQGNDSIRRANLRAPQEILAQETGGVAIVNTNDPSRELARLPDELATRYDLGFAPAREPDGRSHSIKVRLRRGKGLRLRHRASYLHAQRPARESDRTLAALLFGIEEDRLGATVSANRAPAGEGREGARVAAVSISVPLSGLATEPDGDGRRARLRLVIAVRKVAAATEAPPVMREKEVTVRLPADGEASSPAPRHEIVVDVPLGEGEYEIAVGVHDALSSQATYRRLPVE